MIKGPTLRWSGDAKIKALNRFSFAIPMKTGLKEHRLAGPEGRGTIKIEMSG